MILLGLAAGCGPAYQLAVKPAYPNGSWSEGRNQARLTTPDSVEVRLGFAFYEPTRLVFEAEYLNPTKRQLVVSPVGFGYEPARRPAPALAPRQRPRRPARGATVSAAEAAAPQGQPLPALPTRPVPAIDPEPEIAGLHQGAAREAEKATRTDWLGLILTVGSIAADVSSVARRETPSQAESRDALRAGVVAYNVASAANRVEHAVAADALHGQAVHLEGYALRNVTLEPGQRVRGLVYFPRFDSADSLRLRVPVGEKTLTVPFVQTRTRW